MYLTVQVVIANLLEKRKHEVFFVSASDVQEIRTDTTTPQVEIEQFIVEELRRRHEKFEK